MPQLPIIIPLIIIGITFGSLLKSEKPNISLKRITVWSLVAGLLNAVNAYAVYLLTPQPTFGGGTFAGSTNMLPGGSYNVIAHYPGDGHFGAGDSSPVAVTVSSEPSQTQLYFVTFDPVLYNLAGSAPYGSPYVLRTDVMYGPPSKREP